MQYLQSLPYMYRRAQQNTLILELQLHFDEQTYMEKRVELLLLLLIIQIS